MSDDPSMVDSETLKQLLARDLKEAQDAAARDDILSAKSWAYEAVVTCSELLRREANRSRG